MKKEIKIIRFDYNDELKTISIAKQAVWTNLGEEVVREPLHRCAFAPGEIEKVKEFLEKEEDPKIDFLNSIWDEQAIADYEALIAEQE